MTGMLRRHCRYHDSIILCRHNVDPVGAVILRMSVADVRPARFVTFGRDDLDVILAEAVSDEIIFRCFKVVKALTDKENGRRSNCRSHGRNRKELCSGMEILLGGNLMRILVR